MAAKTKTWNEAKTRRINGAFHEMSLAVERFLATCRGNDAPVKSIHVRMASNGTHIRTSIRYQKSALAKR
jgi:hypothetical protein